MGRRSGFGGLVNAVARSAARAARQAEAARRRNIREHDRAVRDQERRRRQAERQYAVAQREAQREAQRQYLEDRAEEAADRTAEGREYVESLESLLQHTLDVDDRISFESLRVAEDFPPFTPPAHLRAGATAPDRQSYINSVPVPGRIGQMFSWVRRKYESEVATAATRYEDDAAAVERREADRVAKLDQLKAENDVKRFAAIWAATQRNAEVSEFQEAYRRGEAKAIVSYVSMVLERSEYPEGFPQNYRVAYAADSKEIVVDYELPSVTIVPVTAEFRYVKARDVIEEKPRKRQEVSSIYQDVVAGIALRTIYEVFESDATGHVSVLTFSGFVAGVDPATGRDVRPYLVSVRTTRDQFEALDLARVDMRVCLRNLGAQVSRQPDELIPVTPVIEFDMADHRFVADSDVLSELESRPNIMDLTPFEFEGFVGNLFSKLGLETRQTQASRDGGVDVVAFDLRPILGGKVVIQAKRYSNTVGVSAVRDLDGTMLNEGANKGILVTTTGYGSDTYKFAKDKPIELIDGGGLLYLCEQAGVHARIIFPEETT